MNKKDVVRAIWAAVIFVTVAGAINLASDAGSKSVWFFVIVMIAHVFKTIYEIGRDKKSK